MAQIKLRRMTDAARKNIVFSIGEPCWTTDAKKLYVGDGSTPGGIAVNIMQSLEAYGAVGDGTTNDTTALQAAVLANIGGVLDASQDYLVDAGYYNPGVRLTGSGAVLKPITGGYQQLNTYANNCLYATGHEYLYKLYSDLYTQEPLIKTYVYGDSTVTTGYTTSKYHLTNFIPAIFRRKGLRPKFTVTNRGVSGSTVDQMSAIPDLGASGADLIFIKYGINDGSSNAGNVAAFATNLRAKLAEIRNHQYGGIANVAIVLVGPNSTSDTPNHRDERWYEQLRGVYEQAARDYRCFYFDTYAYLQDSRWTAGLSMDNPYSDGRAIHPGDAMQAMIWGAVLDNMVGAAEAAEYRTNHLSNTGASYELPLASASPSAYDFGVSIARGLPANGWPADGLVMTIRQADGAVLQYCNRYAGGVTRAHVRSGDSANNSWGPWTGTWQNIQLTNGWSNYGYTWNTAKASMSPDGVVQVSGLLATAGATKTANTVIGTLPSGMTPSADEIAICPVIGAVGDATDTVAVWITTAGEIKLWSGVPAWAQYLSLSSIRYSG